MTKVSVEKIINAAKQEATGSKTTAYLATTFITGCLFAILSIFVLLLVPPTLLLPLWLFLSFIFALAFSPVRYAIEELIRQLFPTTDYNSHELIKRLNSFSYSSLTLASLSNKFFDGFTLTLKLNKTAFLIGQKTPQIVANPLYSEIKTLTPTDYQILMKHATEAALHRRQINNPKLQHLMAQYHIHHLFPLRNNSGLVGLLAVGAKDDGSHLTTKDRKVIEAVSPKLAYAIKNALAYEKVKAKNSQLIDHISQANEQLRKANRQLKRDDKLKDELVYIATHELKNPVTAIKGYLSLIAEGTFGRIPSKLAPAIAEINTSNQQLISLLNNLLQIARSEADRLEISTKPVFICHVVDSVISELKPLADQKGLSINYSCPNRHISVNANAERLKEIINNLVSNSIKYSNKGTITISHEINQDQLTTHVSDEGVGIGEKDHSKIFTRFFRVEEQAAKGIPGTGLGLFIIKQFIERMNGKIWFDSEKNVGSTFSFSLPLTHTPEIKSATQ